MYYTKTILVSCLLFVVCCFVVAASGNCDDGSDRRGCVGSFDSDKVHHNGTHSVRIHDDLESGTELWKWASGKPTPQGMVGFDSAHSCSTCR